jgi:hypothetical protein
MGRFSVKIGKSFDIDEVKVDEGKEVTAIAVAAVNVADASARAFLLKAVVIAELVFLCGAAAYGIHSGSFNYLANVWMATGPLVGGVVTYYFRLNKEAG